MLLQSRIP